MQKRDVMAVGSWIGIGVALWVVAWSIATAIPVFSSLLSLMVCPPLPITLSLVTLLYNYGLRYTDLV